MSNYKYKTEEERKAAKKKFHKIASKKYADKNRLKIRAIALEYNKKPENKIKKSLWAKKKYKDPKYREERSLYVKNYYKSPENRERANKRTRKYRGKNPAKTYLKALKYRLKTEYSLNLLEKVDMFQRQEEKCIVCGVKFKSMQEAYIDHDHTTGRVRGLLHNFCNLLLGKIEKKRDRLGIIIKYLRIEQEVRKLLDSNSYGAID